MKKIILTALLAPAIALAQTYPSPTFNSLTLQNPLTAANGGTGVTTSTGTGSVVLNTSPTFTAPNLGTPSAVTLINGTGLPISTGVSGLGTGVAAGLANPVTGSGSPVLATSPTIAAPTVTGSFAAMGLVTTSDLATQTANTILGNGTGSTASPTALTVPSCSTGSSALNWTSGTGFTCNTAINAATLGAATFVAPGPIGSTTASTGAFTTLSASGAVSGTGFSNYLASPPAIGGTAAAAGTFTTLTASTYKSLPGCQYIETFGGKGDNSTDNLAAWNAAVASFGSGEICIAFGPGQYKFSAEADATPGSAASIAVVGAGRSVTQLIWGATNGFVFNTANQQAAQVHDLSLLTSTTNSGKTALTVNSGECAGSKQSSNIDNVTIEGTGSIPFTNYWGTGIVLNELSFISVNGLDVIGGSGNLGFAMQFNGTATGSCYAFNLMVSKSNFLDLAGGISMGTYAQGLFITQSSFTGAGVAVLIPASEVNVDQLNISDSSFNTTNDQILLLSPMIAVHINHNTLEIPSGQAGVHVNGGGSVFDISGNSFFNEAGSSVGDGVVVDSAASDGVITGNVYKYLLFGNVLGSTSTKWNVQSNTYDTTVTDPNSNSGSNTIGGGSP